MIYSMIIGTRGFQIDSVLKSGDTFRLYDVKNFDGDYFINNGKWYSQSGIEIDDPLEQLRKCESRLRRLLFSLGSTSPIESNLVFMNPQFYLYQAPLGLPISFSRSSLATFVICKRNQAN